MNRPSTDPLDPQIPTISNGGDDAICFTSGPSGAPFAAGVIHAWLAIDREPPLVAAGISMGAISAAAMRRVYQELANAEPPADREQKRWEWYRRYLTAIIENPTAAIWNSVPDPVDFFANLPPVKDRSVPSWLCVDAEDARRHYYLLTQLGVWLANLPLRLSTLATIVVMYVRKKEGYGNPVKREWLFHWSFTKLVLGLSWHILRSPSVISEHHFKGHRKRTPYHPLFGIFWLINLLIAIALVCAIWPAARWIRAALLKLSIWAEASQLFHVPMGGFLSQTINWAFVFALAVVLVAVGVIAGIYIFIWMRGLCPKRKRPGFIHELLRRTLFVPLDITRGLLHPYEARRQLHDLFIAHSPAFEKPPQVQLLVVCAALERQEQVLLKPDLNVVDALTAAVAIPGVFPPKKMCGCSIAGFAKGSVQEQSNYHLIDGGAIRENPIPAFFEWCKQPGNHQLVNQIEARSKVAPSLHVVYNVPIMYPGSAQDAPPLHCPDIVESTLQARQLEKRRDTRQEVRQTDFMSRLEDIRRDVTGEPPGDRGPFSIHPDEIAPAKELDAGNFLSPDPDKLMQIVASGCRATLETLYHKDILDILTMTGGASIDCPTFLCKVASRRDPNRKCFLRGLPEVCASCTGVLEYRAPDKHSKPPSGIIQSYGNPGDPPAVDLASQFENLRADKPRVVFLGSGGVFRGAFHIGVIAAMTETKLYPDLVVGASVGALMGGALCHMTAGPEDNESKVRFDLASLFLNVDSKVALTRTLKNATKQLGTRASKIRLSPAELTRRVEKGSQADPGFAATGAPPALIDALSSLFMIPHRKTGQIASQFVAGHVSEATARFLDQLRRETLDSLNIRTAFMGISMLAGQARGLLGEETKGVDLSSVQPFHREDARNKVSFFCTSSFLNAKMPILLGRDFLTPNPTWDGVYAGLSSSAFPGVFAPRSEADFLPGCGRTDRYFADGGLFDNLPFFPAIEILSAVQRSDKKTDPTQIRECLERRVNHPHLFIAAGLNARPAAPRPYDTLFQIKARADSLSVESKTESFGRAADKITHHLGSIALPKHESNFAHLAASETAFLDATVVAKVVAISPTDPEHINPTFAFCSSTGLKKQRVQESIADGCFQSLAEFAGNEYIGKLLQSGRKIVRVDLETEKASLAPPPAPQKACPFYRRGGEALVCPFTRLPERTTPPSDARLKEEKEVSGIWKRCSEDRAHRLIQISWPVPKRAAPEMAQPHRGE